jgi:hypothetical protein
MHSPEIANGNLGRNRPSMTQHHKVTLAPALLREAADLIDARAAERDVDAERSMGRAIAAFNTLTGNEATETEGWLLLAILKLARATAGKFQPDDLKDCAAYVALALECQLLETDKPVKSGEWVCMEAGEQTVYHQADVYGEKTP